ncbi:MAG TPA: hypothetical protein VLJ37_09585 [bacterium]|nr:hypothetical protein [bacterium]
MTLTIRTRTITEERLDEIAGPTSTYGSSLPLERRAVVAEVQRRDYAHLIIEGTRGSDGVARYFARLDRGGSADAADRAASFETGGRMPLDVGGERIVAVYFGDEDGDGSRDIIARLEDGGLLVFLVTEGEGAAASPPPGVPTLSSPDPGSATASGAGSEQESEPFDPEPYDPEPVPAEPATRNPGAAPTGAGMQGSASSGCGTRNDGPVTTEGI